MGRNFIRIAVPFVGAAFIIIYLTTQLENTKPSDLTAVPDQPPPGYRQITIREFRPEFSDSLAAGIVIRHLQRFPENRRIALKLNRKRENILYLVDFPDQRLEKRFTSSSGTKVRTIWNGKIEERLKWAQKHDNFTPDGYSAPQQTNLYH